MKLSKLLFILSAGAFVSMATSCENQDRSFPDYDGGTTAYFAYQYPILTMALGNGDENLNTTLYNEHKCEIYATIGGSYEGPSATIDFVVDNSLVENLYYSEGGPAVKAMPSEYYTLSGTQLVQNKSLKHLYGVQVQMTDAFFADPEAIKNTYVIPLVMTKVSGADKILTGTPIVEGNTPARTNSVAWDVKPKDYVLYCVRFVNPWDGKYLRRGFDATSIIEDGNSVAVNNKRHAANVEGDEICTLSTASLNKIIFPVSSSIVEDDGKTLASLKCDLALTFNGDECTITSNTEGKTATGSGKFVTKGEKKSWGNKDRDAIYLDYTINDGTRTWTTKDTLVLQTRNISRQVFAPVYSDK